MGHEKAGSIDDITDCFLTQIHSLVRDVAEMFQRFSGSHPALAQTPVKETYQDVSELRPGKETFVSPEELFLMKHFIDGIERLPDAFHEIVHFPVYFLLICHDPAPMARKGISFPFLQSAKTIAAPFGDSP